MENTENIPLEVSEEQSAELADKTNRGVFQYEHNLRIDHRDLAGKVVLDLGSGPGDMFAQEMKHKVPDAKVVSYDYDSVQEKDVTRQSSKHVRGLFSQLPFADNSMDVVLSSAGMPLYLHNQEQMKVAFKEAIRVLKPGGEGRFGPVQYSDVVDTDQSKFPYQRFKKHSVEETKKLISEVLQELEETVTFDFLPQKIEEHWDYHKGDIVYPEVLRIYKTE